MNVRRSRRAAFWLDPGQVTLIREIIALAELEPKLAGSPVRGHSTMVAEQLAVASNDDLRNLVVSADVDVVLIAAASDLGADDVRSLLSARARGVRILSLDPVPASPMELASGWLSSEGDEQRVVDAVRFCPSPRMLRPYREAIEVRESLGQPRGLAVEEWCQPHEGSLGARIYAAMETIFGLMGEPETVSAVYGPGGGQRAPGDTLRSLAGELSAVLRFADGRWASLDAGNNASRWNNTFTMLSPGGRLKVYDDGFEWLGPDGQKIDELRIRASRRVKGPVSQAAIAISEHVKRASDASVPDDGPTDVATVLTMCHAALLSARTGQIESPATIRRMALRG
jgi:hypothetical protein